MADVKKAIMDQIKAVKSIEQIQIEQKLDSLYKVRAPGKEERAGMHASSIIASDADFCYREQVLSYFYKMEEPDLPTSLLKIFAAGNSIHEKWQHLFEVAGISVGIEARAFSPEWSLYMTPDAIVRIGYKLYIVEIKSMNTFAFQHATSHPSGRKQMHLYMHFFGIPQGFVLAEDKNTQQNKVFLEEYNPDVARPYVERLYNIGRYRKRFEDEHKLPSRICLNANTKRAKKCAMCGACFGSKRVLRDGVAL